MLLTGTTERLIYVLKTVERFRFPSYAKFEFALYDQVFPITFVYR